MIRHNSFVDPMIGIIFLLLFMASAAHGETAFSGLVKLYPASISVDASAAFSQKAKDDRESAWRLFDMDTETTHVSGNPVSVKLTLPSVRDIRLIRIYGKGSYIINIYRQEGEEWKRVPALSGIDAAALSSTWNSLEPGQTLQEKVLLIEFIPTGNRRIGIGEMELWGTATGDYATTTLAGLKGAVDAENIIAKNAPHILPIDGTPGEVTLSPDKGVSGDASFQLDQAPSLFKRAYLLYDGYGIPRSAFLRKGINGTVWTGEASIPVTDGEKTAWSGDLEEINPAWLSLGNNRIYMDPSIPSAVRGLKLLAETDSGWNSVSGAAPAELYDSDPATFVQFASAGDSLTLDFDRKVQPLSLLVHVPYSQGGKGKVRYRTNGNWSDAGPDIDFSLFSPGWNEITLPPCQAADGLSLVIGALPEGGGPVVLDEARVAASPVGSPSENSSVVISYPRDGEYFGRTAFIQGFVRSQADLLGKLSVTAEGKKANTDNTAGAFAAMLLKDETRFAAQADDDPWSAAISADLTGVSLAETVPLNHNSAPLSDSGGATGESSNQGKVVKVKVVPGQAKKIQLGKVGLDIPKDGVSNETDISITALSAEELAALDTGLTNVTSPDSGYRFLPHGTRFKKKVTVTLPYDPAVVPPGMTEQDITTYYFDETAGVWKPLEKVRVDTSQKVVESLTDHFTDMINATLTVPDHPQTVSFNPTSIKDIRAADPGAEVNLIEPPKSNNMGDARLSYPIEAPPGRNGLAPQIAVQYNSSGGNGWMGVGWDIPMQSISIDTRWGVPRYDAGLETETYMLEGEQLTPLAHRGELQRRTAEKAFHTRVEGQFRRIVRHGDQPKNYWWEVTDKNGNRYIYGGDPDGNRVDAEAVLADLAGGNIFRWALREVRDTNGNTIRYSFARAADGGTAEGSQFYLKEIRYTGRPGAPGPYSVTFVRDRELGEARRPDVGVDARAGFRVVTADLLRKIEIRINNEMIRSYDFAYREGAFKKTLLKAVSQYGEKGELFNTHEFGYYDDIRNGDGAYKGFDASHKLWNTGSDGVSAGLLGFGDASALAGSEGDSIGGHLYVGFSPAGYNKNLSCGVKIGYTANGNDGVVQLIDIDGDGLPDKVFRKGNSFYCRRNLSGPSGETKYDDNARTVATLPAISNENSNTTTFGAEAYAYGVSTLADYSTTFSEATTYFTDVNGDGLPDLVSDGKVYFNHLENGVPVFTTNSTDTPAAVGIGKVDTEGLIRDYSAVYEKRIDTFPLMDAVRRWTVPYDGFVTISGDVSLVVDTGDKRKTYKTADGVRVAIQQNGSELWYTVIPADDYSAHRPDGLRGIPVKQGDSIYFRVQSRFDGKYDQVSWDPQIIYDNTGPAVTDVNNLDPYHYKASGDFTLAGRTGETQAPLDGTVQISGAFEKNGVTTDDVAVEVYLNGNLIVSRTMAWDATGVINLNEQTHVNKYDMLKFRVRTDSPIDVGKLRWTPAVTYTAADGNTPVRDRNGNSLVTVNAPYGVNLYPRYQPYAPQSPQQPWVAAQSGTVTVTPSVSLAGAAASYVVFTVKKRGVLVAKQVMNAANGGRAGSPLTVSVQKGDELFFDFSCRDADVKGNASVTVDSGFGGTVTAPSAFHTAGTAGAFPVPYRGWSVIAYNGNRDRADRPIDESLLVIDQNYKMDTARVYPLVPFPADGNWRVADDLCWISANRMSSSRLGLDYISVPKPENYAGASAVGRLSSSEQTGVSLSAGYGGVNGGASYSSGSSLGELDFIDMNGDRFPDVVGNGRIQYTAMTGELEPKNRNAGVGSVRKTANDTYNFNIGGSVAFSKPENGGENEVHGTLMPPLGLSAGYGNGSSDTSYDLVDMNGDGLPDRVSWDNGNLTVSLDVGYGFAPPAVWGGGNISSSGSTSIDVGGSMGYNDGIYGFGGGASLTRNSSGTTKTLIDMNGDGLPDLVVKEGGTLQVAFNKGTAFAGFVTWPGGLDKDLTENVSMSLGGGLYFSIPIPIPYCTCSIIINPGFNVASSMGREESAIRDIDGDGYPDFLSSDKDDSITVAENLTGRTNLLKSVKRPLGATMEFEYVRSGNTYDQPQSRWVLSRSTVFDGFPGDGVDKLVTTYTYQGGRYDRLERDFYGYRTVKEEQRDAGNNEAVYRKTVYTYKTDSYYTKGLPEREIMKDGNDRPYTETDNTYRLVDAFSSFGTIDPQSTTATVFPQLIRTDRYFYEGNPSPGKFTYTEFGYDGYGNVSRFFDAGDVGARDDVQADITYTNFQGPYIVGKPARIIVTSNQKELRRREGDYDANNGNQLQVRQYLESGQAAVTDLSYFGNGTLRSVTGPANLKGERYSLAYEYDPVLASFVTGITDSFGYKSTASYNYKYGKVETTTDTNDNRTIMAYDNFGRTGQVFGPYQASSGIPDITFEYHPEAAVPWAQTRHFDPYRSPTDTIDTVLFTDGLKRVIQTKKDATLHTGPDSAPVDGMTVSGRVIFDGMGRSVLQYYPVTEGLGRAGVFNTAFDNIPPTVFTYDVLDRTLKTVLPDQTFTTVAYGFGSDRNGTTQFETVVTDANGIAKRTYKDVEEEITSVRETNKGGAEVIWTSYDYDPLKQIVEVKDDHNNLTTVSYDNLGRRTIIDNPDTGKTETRYDLAGNAIARITANLARTGKQIRYDYDYNRLKTISYPDFPGNNVAYTYGGPGAQYNRAGRIVTVTDESGKEERFYGKLGEMTKEIKTVASKTQGASANSPEVYTTEYTFDTFGRLQRLIYPDGETLTNLYDSGGLLRAATGIRGSFRYDYLKRLEYDKFEQRAFIQYGNNTRSSYSYNPYNRRLANLKGGKGDGNLFQNLLYGYDKVGNILSLKNDVAVPSPNEYGGPTDQSFRYDDLYRLTDASGIYQFAPGKQDIYNFAMSYDTIHNILAKNQEQKVVQPSGTLVTQKKTTYNWNYAYSNQKPHAPVHIGERTYSYDYNGNQTGWTSDVNGTRRNIVWDEENRIRSIFDNGHQKDYVYNDAGERVIKRGPQGETVYVNQFFVVRNRTLATKHIFAGNTRIASRMMPGNNGTTNSSTTTTATTFPGQGLYHRSAQGNLNGKNTLNNPHYSGAVTTTDNSTPGNTDNFLYFYHPDHLGSTSYVTDANGKLYEHIEYFPFGETWVEEHSNTQRTPYLYTGKELDEETGLYYYGARYYDPRTNVWQSTDPILGKYLPSGDEEKDKNLPGRGGVFNPINLSLFNYGHENPVKYSDPDVRDVAIKIERDKYTSTSVSGTISVTSDQTKSTFNGYTLENAHAGDKHNKPPIPLGTYDAFVRKDHTPQRVELQDVPGYENVQIHPGNTVVEVKGCFAVGTTRSKDYVGGSKSAMAQINNIIAKDGTGNISVTVKGANTRQAPQHPFDPYVLKVPNRYQSAISFFEHYQ